ncbi:MAG: exo-alpha-sialidase [Thaumarchaeota archaeon]|nr:exo-alpha-sialidase [Nitrososphaerota archaeon]
MKSFLFSVIILTAIFSVMPFTMVSGIPLPGLPVGETHSFRLLDMAALDRTVYIVYDDGDLYFTKSSNGGLDFGKPLMINDQNSRQLGFSRIAAAENSVYVSWNGRTDNSLSNEHVLFRESMDGGNSFAPPRIISKNGTDSQLSQLIAVKNHIYVTMMNEYFIDEKIHANVSFIASSDNGKTFERIIDLLPNAVEGAALPPPVQIQVTADGKTIYVIGEYSTNCSVISSGCTNQIFFKKSTDFGTTFSAPKIIYSTNQYIWELHTYVLGENVYLAWGEKSRDINFMKSDDGGETFSLPVNLTEAVSTGISVYPNGIGLAVNESEVDVIWGYVNDGKLHLDDYTLSLSDDNPPKLFLIRSTDNGNTFNPLVNLTGNDGYTTFDIQTSDSFVHLTWSDYKPNGKSDILFRTISDNGTSFDQVINLSANLNEASSMPLLAATGNNVYVSWWVASLSDVLFKGSNDNGNTFGILTNLNHENNLNDLDPAEIKVRETINTRLVLSPLKQFQSGVTIKDIMCENDFVLIQKSNTNQPACVKIESAPKLIERGWAKPV